MDFFDKRILASYTKEQKEHLGLCIMECHSLGAKKEHLAPLYALVYIDFAPWSAKELAAIKKKVRP